MHVGAAGDTDKLLMCNDKLPPAGLQDNREIAAVSDQSMPDQHDQPDDAAGSAGLVDENCFESV